MLLLMFFFNSFLYTNHDMQIDSQILASLKQNETVYPFESFAVNTV